MIRFSVLASSSKGNATVISAGNTHVLAESGRPMALQNRISGNWGHLSNTQAVEFVRSIAHAGQQHLVLAHLSPECNTPELAYRCMRRTLDELQLPTQLVCAPMSERLDWREIV